MSAERMNCFSIGSSGRLLFCAFLLKPFAGFAQLLALVGTLWAECWRDFQILCRTVFGKLLVELVIFLLSRINFCLMALASSEHECECCGQSNESRCTSHRRSLKRSGDCMVLVRWEKHVLGEIDLDPVTLPNCDCRRNLNEPIQDGGC